MAKKAKAPDLAALFLARFGGLDRAYGEYRPSPNGTPGVKVAGRAVTRKAAVTVELSRAHLAGKVGLGIVPIRDDATCRWGAIDVDVYTLDHAALDAQCAKLKLPLILFRTKSGGAHLFLFLAEWSAAGLVRGKLMEWAAALGHPDVEVFPKQAKLASTKDVGNWINLPYFGTVGERFAWRDGKWLTNPADFLRLADRMAIGRATLEAFTVPAVRASSKNGKGSSTVPETIPKGERDNRLTSMGGKLLSLGYSEEEITATLMAANETRCDPPLPEKRVQEIASGLVKRYADKDKQKAGEDTAALDRMNAEWAVVVVGSRVGVLQRQPFEQRGEICVLGLGDFRALLCNQRLPPRDDEPGPLSAPWWLHQPGRSTYRGGVVFDPTGIAPASALNQWQGWHVAPDPKLHPERRCRLFLAHIRDHIARGDEAIYNKVIGWIAQMFQHPASKLPTSLVLLGRKGSGKTVIGKHVGYLLGRHYQVIASPRYISGQFNGHMSQLLLLHADEAVWGGDHRAESILKDLITGHDHLVEFKGKEPIRMRNYMRVLITGEKGKWLVPSGGDERRFIVYDVVNEDHLQDGPYFAAIEQELRNGGYEALLAYLLAFDWKSGAPDLVPGTQAGAEQRHEGLPSELRFLYEITNDGQLPGDYHGMGTVEHEALHDTYTAWAGRLKLGRVSDKPRLTAALNEFFRDHGEPELGILRPKIGNFQRRCHQFPPLAQVRAAFARFYGGVEVPWTQGEGGTASGWWPAPQPRRSSDAEPKDEM